MISGDGNVISCGIHDVYDRFPPGHKTDRLSLDSIAVIHQLDRAFARDSQRMRYNAFAHGLEYYEFLDRTQKQLQDEPDTVTAKLEEIQSRLDNRTNAVAMFAGNENSIALNRQLADGFLASMDAQKIERAEYDLPLPEKNEALVIDGSGIDQETLDGYILESYTYFAMPQGELTGAVNAAEAVLKGRPQDEAVTCMRQLKQLDLEKLADYKELLEKFTEAGAVRTAGGAAAINSEADRYDKILSPF